jgi:thiol-disulfide isomerase/thioredoxin
LPNSPKRGGSRGFFSGRREKDKKEIVFEQVTDALFTERLAAAEKPIMLFLWSNTCPFCRKMAVNVKNVLQRHRELIAGLHAEAATVPGIAGALHLRGVPATAFSTTAGSWSSLAASARKRNLTKSSRNIFLRLNDSLLTPPNRDFLTKPSMPHGLLDQSQLLQ